jgi:hypothetical protein
MTTAMRAQVRETRRAVGDPRALSIDLLRSELRKAAVILDV